MMYRSDYQPDTLGSGAHPEFYSSSEAISPPSSAQPSQRSQAPASPQDLQNLLGDLTPNKRAIIETLLTQWLATSEAVSYPDPAHLRHAS